TRSPPSSTTSTLICACAEYGNPTLEVVFYVLALKTVNIGRDPRRPEGLRTLAEDREAPAETDGGSRRPAGLRESVLRLARVDLVDPLQDAAPEVLDVREADRPQEVHRLGAAAAHLALRHDLAIARELVVP